MTTAHNGIYMHEYGHTLQSRNYGIFYLPYIGPRSLLSAASSSDHREKWYEREASAYARRYFGKLNMRLQIRNVSSLQGKFEYYS